MKTKHVIIVSSLILAVIIIAGLIQLKRYSDRPQDGNEAVQAVKAKYPEFADYPSDNLPPKSIEVIDSELGWRLGFHTEGSGLPGILASTCFLVTNKGEVNITGKFEAVGNAGASSLDLFTCTQISDELAAYFSDKVTKEVIAANSNYRSLGLGGGIDAFLIMKKYPGILPHDFKNVVARGGNYIIDEGELRFSGNAASNSPTLTKEGMKTLLTNLAKNFDMRATSNEDIDSILNLVRE